MCPAGDTCALAPSGSGVNGGSAKYGDYNGSACANGTVYLAWASGAPPEGGCAMDGISCVADVDCCSAHCVSGACAPSATAVCAPNGGACVVSGDCCSQNCEAGSCFAQVGVYATSTSCVGPDCSKDTGMSVDVSVLQSETTAFEICGRGKGFSPGGLVGFGLVNEPGPNGTTNPPVSPIFEAMAAGDGTVGFLHLIETPEIGACTPDQLKADVTLQATDEQTGAISSTTFPAGYFCPVGPGDEAGGGQLTCFNLCCCAAGECGK